MGILGTAIGKIKEARNKRNERIDKINRMEAALKNPSFKTDVKGRDEEALALSQKTKLPYKDTLAFMEHKRKGQARTEKMKGMARDVLKAGKQSATNIEASGMFGGGGSIMKEGFGKSSSSIMKTGKGNDGFLDFSRVRDESIFGGGGKKRTTKHRSSPKQPHKTKGRSQIIINIPK